MAFSDGYGPPLTPSQVDLKTCEEFGASVVTYVWYRLLQAVWIIVAALSTLNILRVYFIYIKSSKLHVNIRILLTLFLFSAILINIIVIITQTYQLTLSFTFEEPCNVFLSKTFYMIFNIGQGFFTELYLIAMAIMTFERSLATVLVSSYERMTGLAGIAGSIVAVLSAVLVECLLYSGASFDELQISTTSAAYEVADRINIILLFNICSSAFTMATMIALLLMNIRRKKFAIGVISQRFQAEENIVTTEFIARIAFVQLIAFCVQSLCGLLLRTYGSYIYDVNNEPIGRSLRLLLQAMPLFTLIMSIVVATTMRSIAARRRTQLRNLMCTINDIEYNARFLQEQWSKTEPKSSKYLH